MVGHIEDDAFGPELRNLKRENQDLGARNKRLAELLKSSRDKLNDLYVKVEELGEPASTYGIYLAPGTRDGEAEVHTSGRRMRLKISPLVEPQALVPGTLVRLGEGTVVVEACGFTPTGQIATMVERIGTDRAVVADQQGAESLVMLAEPLLKTTRAGDTVLVNSSAGYAFERIEKTEVNQLSLEEIPDVTYEDIGGLSSQIETIQDSVELPFSHPELYAAYDLTPPKGLLLYGPPGCGKTLIAKAVANSLSQRIGDGGQAHFINVKGPELLNKFVGETERRIRLIFERARELASEGNPVIVFFDEMESIFRTRGSGVSSDMETAILRPGRLDIKVRVSRPNKEESKDILARYLTDEIPLAAPRKELIDAAAAALFAPRPFVRLELVDGTAEVLHYSDFVSGALIANVVDRAKKLAIKDHLSGVSTAGVTADHLREAVRDEQDESEDMPNTANPDEWARITGRHGKRVVAAEVIG